MGRRAQPKDSIMALNAVSPLTEANHGKTMNVRNPAAENVNFLVPSEAGTES